MPNNNYKIAIRTKFAFNRKARKENSQSAQFCYG